jgi:hypothetical protein
MSWLFFPEPEATRDGVDTDTLERQHGVIVKRDLCHNDDVQVAQFEDGATYVSFLYGTDGSVRPHWLPWWPTRQRAFDRIVRWLDHNTAKSAPDPLWHLRQSRS